MTGDCREIAAFVIAFYYHTTKKASRMEPRKSYILSPTLAFFAVVFEVPVGLVIKNRELSQQPLPAFL